MIRIILYAVIFYFIYRLLDSIFRPKRASAGSGNASGNKSPRQKVSVQYDRDKAKSKVGKDVGEYVDFEEVKKEE